MSQVVCKWCFAVGVEWPADLNGGKGSSIQFKHREECPEVGQQTKRCTAWEDGQHCFVMDVVDGTIEKPFCGELIKKCACGSVVKLIKAKE